MFLDVGLSIFYTFLAGKLFGISLEANHFFYSLLFGLLPDIDAPFELLFYKTLGGKIRKIHRELTHYPIIYPPIILLTFFIFGGFWAFLLGINILSHFLHDSFWYGWGIRWLWPFKHNTYKFFADKKGLIPFVSTRFIENWTRAELPWYMEKYGDSNWFRHQYLPPTKMVWFEIFVFLLGLYLLIRYLALI